MPSSRAVVPFLVLVLVAAGCTDDSTADTPPTGDTAPADDVVADDVAADRDLGADAVDPAAATADESFDESYLNTRAGRFPSLDDPVLVEGTAASWLDADDIVMGIAAESGEAQAYPVDQMAYHHIANTSLAGEPFLVTY